MLSQNLKKYREKKGLSQKKLAGLVNMSQQGYAKYETGSATPDPERLALIAEILEVSVDQILSYSEKNSIENCETEQRRITPEKKILLAAFERASEEDRRVLWTLLERYLTPNEKQYLSQLEEESQIS